MRLHFQLDDQVLQSAMETIASAIRIVGGRAFLVGGCVRDAVLGKAVKDLDIEVFGVPLNSLCELLSSQFPFDLVGRSFPTLKLRGLPIDISIPYRRSAVLGNEGSQEKIVDPLMSLREAAARRDFTMNAMVLDPETHEVIDHYGGLNDLKAKVLRHTSDKFTEDPLRVFRGMQFAARFELEVAPETVRLCRTVTSEGVAAERIFVEWKKLILWGRRPSLGLTFLRDCAWVRSFPELNALIGCEQGSDIHSGGDVWTHTLNCMDVFATERIDDEQEDLVVGLAVLCHGFGESAFTTRERGRIHTMGQEPASEQRTRSFLRALTNQQDLIEAVIPLVRTHSQVQTLYDRQASDSAIRRLARQVGRIDRLVRVARCHQMGRSPRQFERFPAGEWLLQRAQVLDVEQAAPKPLVIGRHLVELGLGESPQVGRILDACYEAQLEGVIVTVEAGIEHAKRLINQGW